MSYRDLQIIVDVLDDYSKLLQEHIEKNPPQNFWAKHNKEELVKRTMQISDRLADVIGLDKSYPKCKKHLEKQQEAPQVANKKQELKTPPSRAGITVTTRLDGELEKKQGSFPRKPKK